MVVSRRFGFACVGAWGNGTSASPSSGHGRMGLRLRLRHNAMALWHGGAMSLGGGAAPRHIAAWSARARESCSPGSAPAQYSLVREGQGRLIHKLAHDPASPPSQRNGTRTRWPPASRPRPLLPKDHPTNKKAQAVEPGHSNFQRMSAV